MRKKVKTSITMSREMLERVAKIAKEDGRSTSNLIERFVLACLEELEKGNRRPGRTVRLRQKK